MGTAFYAISPPTGSGGSTTPQKVGVPKVTGRQLISGGTTGFATVNSQTGSFDTATDKRYLLQISNNNSFPLYLYWDNIELAFPPTVRDQYAYDAIVPAGYTGVIDFADDCCYIGMGFGTGQTSTQPIPVTVISMRYEELT